METQPQIQKGEFFRDIILIDLVLFTLTALGCWLLGTLSWRNYGIVLGAVGTGAVIAGVLLFIINPRPRAEYHSRVSTRPAANGDPNRLERIVSLYCCGISPTLLLGLAGVIAIGFGMLVLKLAW